MTTAQEAHSGTTFRIVRAVLGLNIAELAERAELTKDLLARIESGEHQPSTYVDWHLRKVLAEALGEGAVRRTVDVTLGEFIGHCEALGPKPSDVVERAEKAG